MKRLSISLLLLLAMGMLVLTSCHEDNESSLPGVSNVTYEPTMGGAIIHFTAPNSNDLLYVKASYINSMGERVHRATSIFDNQIEIEGLADETKSYEVNVTAVDKWGGESPVTTIFVQPNRSYINIINDNLEIEPICGGMSFTWVNPLGADNSEGAPVVKNPKPVYIVVDYTDASNVTRTRYIGSSQMYGQAKVRGLFKGMYNVTYHVEDISGNKTAQSNTRNIEVPEEALFPKYYEEDSGEAGVERTYIWELVKKKTTLQEAWEYRNASIFDGIIDSKDIVTRNYCGTDCDYSGSQVPPAVTYGSAIPWDTEDVDIVIDMHQVVSISRIVAWQRAYKYDSQPYAGTSGQTSGTSDDYDYYQADNIKRFKVFGSMDLENWFLIQDCDIATNSTAGALPQYWTNPQWFNQTNVYMPTNASYQAALDGHEWELASMTENVRYVRVRLVESWDLSKRGVSGISEINLYGAVVKDWKTLKEEESASSAK